MKSEVLLPKVNVDSLSPHRAFSLLEMLAVVVLIGIIAAIAVQRFSASQTTAKKNACYVNKGDIELQAQLWYRNKGAWPATNLSDIAADVNYFPQGLPTCPVDGSAYTINSTTHLVTGHTH